MAKKATTLHDNLGNDLLPVTNASITYMDDGNSVQAEIQDLKLKTQYNKGHYTTEQDLLTAYPNGIQNPQSRKGWYAIVGSTDTVWIWDIEGNKWSDSGVSSGGVESVNGLEGEVILTGGNINATATINDTSKTELINTHLTDIYSELDNKVDLDSSQLITGTKVFTEVIGLANTSEGTVDQIKHINSNFLITSGTGQNLLNIDEGLEKISAFNRELAYEDEIQQIQGDYATKSELNTAIQDVTDMIPTSVSELTNDSNYATVSQVNTKQDALTATQLQAVDSGANTTNIAQISTNTQSINSINAKIPSQANFGNQLADKAFVNDAINSITAFYITYNANGDPFPTKSSLTSATTYYSGGQVRVPTRNDYAIVLADESEGNATTRYIYYNQWEYQYTVNETALTSSQLSAINSGITSTLVGKISSNELMINSLSEQVATDYATKSQLNSYLPLTAGFGKAITGDLYVNTNIYQAGKQVANKEDVPTNNNQLTNGAGYITGITSSQVTSALGYTPYNSTNPNGYVTSSGSVASATNATKLNNQDASYYLNYNNFTNIPTIPTVNNGTLTIQQDGTTLGTFTANQSGNTTVNITGGGGGGGAELLWSGREKYSTSSSASRISSYANNYKILIVCVDDESDGYIAGQLIGRKYTNYDGDWVILSGTYQDMSASNTAKVCGYSIYSNGWYVKTNMDSVSYITHIYGIN